MNDRAGSAPPQANHTDQAPRDHPPLSHSAGASQQSQTRRPDLAARLDAFLHRLFRQNEFVVKLGLEPMQAALAACGDPSRAFPCVLIAGTNGKGSVASMLAGASQAAGLNVGLFTSPHLISFHERIRLNGRPLSDEDLAAIGPAVLAHFGGPGAWPHEEPLAELLRGGPGHHALPRALTYFELVTLMGVLAFARARCELGVIEVGLGGRLDATNALSPCLSVITAIGLDHQAQLGSTLEAIAGEKAGILRRDVPAVVASRVATATLLEHTRRVGAPAVCLGRDFEVVSRQDVWQFEGLGVELPLPPRLCQAPHQRDNIAAAVASLVVLARQGVVPESRAAWRRGLEATRWPGRLWMMDGAVLRQAGVLAPESEDVEGRGGATMRDEEPRGEPQLLLDAAHNAPGARALARELERRYAGRPLGLVLGMMKDKDIEGITAALCALEAVTAVCVVPVRSAGGRAAAPEVVCQRGGIPGRCAMRDLASGLRQAAESVGARGVVVVAGSVYLLGEVFHLLGAQEQARCTYEASQG